MTLDFRKTVGRRGTELVVDGRAIPTSSPLIELNGKFGVVVTDSAYSTLLLGTAVVEIRDKLRYLSLTLPANESGFTWMADWVFEASALTPGPPFRFDFTSNLAQWSNPWTYASLTEEVRRLCPEFGFEFLNSKQADHCEFAPADPGVFDTAGEVIAAHLPSALRMLSAALSVVERERRKDALFTFFEFPAPVSTACQQYLLYFVQFLSDLGIEADAEIKQDAQRVLFSVTPKSGSEALQKIQEALQVYLDLPASPAALNEAGSDMAVQQLKANVFHLQGQLAIAEAVLQAKDATIEATRLTAYRYRQMLMTGSTEGRDAAPASEEPLVSDYVKVTPYKGKGFTVDLPALLRMLKRKVGD